MDSYSDKNFIEECIEILKKIADKLSKKVNEELLAGRSNTAKKVSSITTNVLDVFEKLNKERDHINKFIELIKNVRATPEDLLNLLALSEVPITKSGGRAVVEGIVGYRGLGIEAIDHHISKITYEGVKPEENIKEEGPLTDVSITSFVYRVPPFELTRCPYEKDKDAEITGILGARHVWFVRPENISENSWKIIQNKTIGEGYKDVIIGSYDRIGSVLQLKTLKLVDITQKCLEIEIEKPAFFLKLGSTTLEDELADINNKDRLIEELRIKETHALRDLGRGLSSWKIRLDYVYFCYKGLAISTDPYDLECPYKNCSYRKAGICDGKRYWSAKYYRRKPYPKIYPLRSVVLDYGGVQVFRDSLPKNIIAFTAYNKRKVESVWYGVEIGTWFIRARPTIRIYFDKNARIGYSIPTSLLELSFDIKWLNNEIKRIIEENDEIRKSIALKYILYKSLRRVLDYNKLSKTISNLLEGKEEAETFRKYYIDKHIDEDFLMFARRLLLHSLEHMLTQYILFKLVGVDYSFVMTRYYYKNSAKIFLIENAKNGRLGIVDTIVKDIEDRGLPAFLLEFTNWLRLFLNEHDRDFNRLSNERRSKADKLISKTIKRLEKEDTDKAEKLKRIDEIVQRFSEELKRAGIQMDITLARTFLLVSNRIPENLIEGLEDYFDDILEKHGFPLCWDGCNACIRLERYCGEGVYQVLTTSKMLLKAFIERVGNLITSGITESSREVGRIIVPLLQSAKKSIDISSPFISPKYARMLVEKSKNGIKVRVLTRIPKSEEEIIEKHGYHLESLKILEENISDYLDVKIVEKLHAKIYIIDNKIAISGSANLTETGMYGNYEHIDVKFNPRDVSKIINQFEGLWKSSKSF